MGGARRTAKVGVAGLLLDGRFEVRPTIDLFPFLSCAFILSKSSQSLPVLGNNLVANMALVVIFTSMASPIHFWPSYLPSRFSPWHQCTDDLNPWSQGTGTFKTGKQKGTNKIKTYWIVETLISLFYLSKAEFSIARCNNETLTCPCVCSSSPAPRLHGFGVLSLSVPSDAATKYRGCSLSAVFLLDIALPFVFLHRQPTPGNLLEQRIRDEELLFRILPAPNSLPGTWRNDAAWLSHA